MKKMILFLVGMTALAACSSSPKQEPAEMTATPRMEREVAGRRCLFDLEDNELRRAKVYFRKEISFSSGILDPSEYAKFLRLPAPYMNAVKHYMRTEGGFKGSEMEMAKDFLSGDGGFVQRIIWGKGSARRTFINVSHYPGDNHYGTIYEVTNKSFVPVLSIVDGDYERCNVFVP